jgi:hypothetical protein
MKGDEGMKETTNDFKKGDLVALKPNIGIQVRVLNFPWIVTSVKGDIIYVKRKSHRTGKVYYESYYKGFLMKWEKGGMKA